MSSCAAVFSSRKGPFYSQVTDRYGHKDRYVFSVRKIKQVYIYKRFMFSVRPFPSPVRLVFESKGELGNFSLKIIFDNFLEY